MKVPFTWKVTGWFVIGWSAEFPVGEVRPLRYFGEDLVAYRDESGELHVLSGHFRHLGAHIGHGGDTAARWSATASSARFTGGGGDPMEPTATSRTNRTDRTGR